MKREIAEDTIAAVATPPGEGGIGIVRLSGPDALAVAARVFTSSRGRDVQTAAQRVFHGHVHDAEGRMLDEVLLHRMRGPSSYTGEDVAEINAHGGPAPLNAILEECLKNGARLAEPGEFTRRAFLNGRLDLVQAEAVIDRIHARTRAGLQAASAAASGTLSQQIHTFRDAAAEALARIEAAVDFPEADLPDLVDDALFANLEKTRQAMEALLATADTGMLYREGVSVAIAGRPNTGKSSLFNALLRDARAIVSAEAGTTRDRIEEYITIGGIPVRLIDTAGLRETDHAVERIGVGRAREALQSAGVILFLIDASADLEEEDRHLAREIAALETPVVIVLNKSDLAPDAPLPELELEAAAVQRVSAMTGAGLQDLETSIEKVLLHGASADAAQPMLTRLHQKESLRRAGECLGRALRNRAMSPEFPAQDLREALMALGEITGETTPDDILDSIFSRFCIGK
jgi:tRNA modification GTPase